MKTILSQLSAVQTPKRFLQKLFLLLVLLVSAVMGARAQLQDATKNMDYYKNNSLLYTENYSSWGAVAPRTDITQVVLENNSATAVEKTVTVDEAPSMRIVDFSLDDPSLGKSGPVIFPVQFFTLNERLYMVGYHGSQFTGSLVGLDGGGHPTTYTPNLHQYVVTVSPFSKVVVTISTSMRKWLNRSFLLSCGCNLTRRDFTGRFSIDKRESVQVTYGAAEPLYKPVIWKSTSSVTKNEYQDFTYINQSYYNAALFQLTIPEHLTGDDVRIFENSGNYQYPGNIYFNLLPFGFYNIAVTNQQLHTKNFLINHLVSIPKQIIEFTVPPRTKIVKRLIRTTTTQALNWKSLVTIGKVNYDGGSGTINTYRNTEYTVTEPINESLHTTRFLAAHQLGIRNDFNYDAIIDVLKHPKDDQPVNKLATVIAHRGLYRGTQCPDGFYAAENSLAAVKHAWQHGYEAAEVDIKMTKDGYAVLSHDLNLGRVVKVPANWAGSEQHSGKQFIPVSEVKFSEPGYNVPLGFGHSFYEPSHQVAGAWELVGGDDANGIDPYNLSSNETLSTIKNLLEYIRINGIHIVLTLDIKNVSAAKACWEAVKTSTDDNGVPAWKWVIFKMPIAGLDWDIRAFERDLGLRTPSSIFGGYGSLTADAAKFKLMPYAFSMDADRAYKARAKFLDGRPVYVNNDDIQHSISHGNAIAYIHELCTDIMGKPYYIAFEIDAKNQIPAEVEHIRWLVDTVKSRGIFVPVPEVPGTNLYWNTNGYGQNPIEYEEYSEVYGKKVGKPDLRPQLNFAYISPNGVKANFITTDFAKDLREAFSTAGKRNACWYTRADITKDCIPAANRSSSIADTSAVAPTTTAPAQAATALEDVQLYPNPARNLVSVAFYAAAEQPAIVELTDVLGSVILKKAVATAVGNNNLDIDTSAIPAGVYVMHIKVGSSRITKKLLIEK